jgi:hypothetical protein
VASAQNDVTLLAQSDIQPFAMSGGVAVYKDMHFYELPWPRHKLQQLENAIVTMKVTLSYFIEPNLSGRAATRPETYRSFGLRFELKKRNEPREEFKKRLSKQTVADANSVPGGPTVADNAEDTENQNNEPSHWLLGPKAVNAGSLHCDHWRGHAVDLASHDHIAIYPVGGWWKTHLGKGRADDKGRYSLAVSITAEGQGVDLYTEIAAELDAKVVAAVPVSIPAG